MHIVTSKEQNNRQTDLSSTLPLQRLNATAVKTLQTYVVCSDKMTICHLKMHI